MSEPARPDPPAMDELMLARTIQSPAGSSSPSDSGLLDTLAASSQAAAGVGGDESKVTLSALRRLGRFVVLRPLGEGGMGRVYAAYDEELDRKVALKVLHRSQVGEGEQRSRILREAQAMARVSHPNVVHVYGVSEAEGELFIAMEFIDGQTLAAYQRQRPRSADLLAIYRAAGHGLLAAHQAGLVHRDFKPDNVLIGRDGRPRVADFGLARAELLGGVPGGAAVGQGATTAAATAASSAASAASATSMGGPSRGAAPEVPVGSLLSSPLSMAGQLVGTPAYMAPEQYAGGAADGRSDQFSFCVALYEALYGQLPFSGDSLAQLAANVVAGRVRIPAQGGLLGADGSEIPASIFAALQRGLAVDPAKRFPSMAELLRELDFDPHHSPQAAPRLRRGFSKVVLIGVIAMMIFTRALRHSGNLTLQSTAIAGTGLFMAMIGAAILLRRQLVSNSFHRGMIATYVCALGCAVAMRWAGVRIGLTLQQEVPFDLLSISFVISLSVYQFFRPGWIIAAIGAAGGIATLIWQAHAVQIALMFYPIVVSLTLLIWSRLARG